MGKLRGYKENYHLIVRNCLGTLYIDNIKNFIAHVTRLESGNVLSKKNLTTIMFLMTS
jgi:hypothetical protein